MALSELMKEKKGAGERTLFQNSREICFSKQARTLLPASLSKVLTCIFSAASLAFQKTRIISLGKNIEEGGNAPNPSHAQRALTYLSPSHSPSQSCSNLSTSCPNFWAFELPAVGRFRLTHTPPRQAQSKVSLPGTTFFSLASRASASGAETPPPRSPSCVPWKSNRDRQ